MLRRNTNILKKIISLSVLVFCFVSCQQLEVEPDLPEIIKREITEFSKEGMAQPTGASVCEYELNDNTIYVFYPGMLMYDAPARVTDAQGELLGYLGGYDGDMLINDEDFSNAAFIRTVWEN
jgi:hypothetical protein